MTAARRILVVLVASIAALALQASSSGAAIRYNLLSTFGAFTTPMAMTVDQSNRNVYVIDAGTSSVNILGSEGGSPAGGLVSPLTGGPEHTFHFSTGVSSGVAIDETAAGPSSRDLYVSDLGNNVVDKFKLNASHEYEYICQFTGYERGCVKEPAGVPTWIAPAGVTVDSTGNVYIASFGPGKGAVYEFNAQGVDVRKLSGGDIGAPCNECPPVGVAVDLAGTLYVNNYERNVVKIDTEGHESFLDSNNSRAVAVDAHEDVFVDDGSYIAEYNPAGVQINRFGVGEIGEHSSGVAVNNTPGNENVYVTDRDTEPGTVKMFHPATVPDVTTGEAENVGKTTATVTGSVTPVGGLEAEYSFQYHNSEESLETPFASAGSGSSSVPVSTPLTALKPGMVYSYRLVAKNTNGENIPEEYKTFTTPPAVTMKPCPPLTLCGPNPNPNLCGTSATLCVFINPEGLETNYLFAYGLVGHGPKVEEFFEYEHFTPFESAGSGGVEKRITVPITGLKPATTYHYRIRAINEINEFSETIGNDETLTTPPAEPTVNDQPPFATGITLHDATLHGTVNPGNGVTTYHFQYGTSTAYGSSTPEAYTQLNYEEDPSEQHITGLQPGTTYHYRLVAANSSATTNGPDETFTTLPGAPPTVETGSATQITPSTTTITGTIDPAGQVASYDFEVGTSTSYGTQLFGAISNREEVTAALAGLLPETIYHYRLVASDAAGITYGADHTFTTPGYPAKIVQPVAPPLLPIPVFPPEGKSLPPLCKKGFVKKGRKCVKKHHKPPRKKHKKKKR